MESIAPVSPNSNTEVYACEQWILKAILYSLDKQFRHFLWDKSDGSQGLRLVS